MKNFILSVVILLGGISMASAHLITQPVEYKQGNVTMEGYLAYDDSFSGKRPGILVVHEWLGLNDYAKMRADMLAKLGYVAFAADIYGKGVRANNVQEATELSSKYKNDRTLLRQRAQAALDTLKALPQVDSSRLAAIGYCFGGTTVLELARSGADLKGVVSFHGGLNTPTPQDAKNIKAEILALHGRDDPFAPKKEVMAFEQEMKNAHVKYNIVLYPKAVHGFTNPANKGELSGVLYNASADKKSWQAMQEFLNRIFRENESK